MLTVEVKINGRVVALRRAVNVGDRDQNGRTLYRIDGDPVGREGLIGFVRHRREDGAVALAMTLLQPLAGEV